MTGYDSLLLDYDGVLVSVVDRAARMEACYEVAVADAADRAFSLDREAIRTLSHTVPPEEVHSMSEELGIPPETLWEFRDDMLAAVLKDAARAGTKRPYPDIAVLSEMDVPLGIASNNQRRIVEYILDEYEFGEYFETVHGREPRLGSLKQKKPAPTLLERARDDIGCSNPLYVGDKQTDIVAAERAGMDAALIRRKHNRDRSVDVEPAHEVTSLEELLPLLE